MKKGYQKAAGWMLSVGVGLCYAGSCFASENPALWPEQMYDTVYSWEDAQVIEAEEGKTYGNCHVTEGIVSYVEGFQQEGDYVTIPLIIEETGFYDIALSTQNIGGYKENYLLLDGEQLASFPSENGTAFEDSVVEYVYLEKGAHELTVASYWGFIKLDCIRLKPADSFSQAVYEIEPKLVNPNASENARRLMAYLCDIYGKRILSGQYCDQGAFGIENACIWKTTGGSFPAVLGLDMIEYSPSRASRGSEGKAVEYAKEYWEEQNGIVTMCWHWNAPDRYIKDTWYMGFYSDHADVNLNEIMNGEDEEGYELLLSDIDSIAGELKVLADADVPVLWRPLHEASGGWFWWGADGPDACIWLYRLMYERMTEEHGLNNLIWIWNGQDPDWYPGDEYVDIIGVDLYPGERVYAPQTDAYRKAVRYAGEPKLVVMSENGCLFDPELAVRDGTMWGFFCTWGGEFVTLNKGFNKISEQYTEEAMMKRVYESEYVITRDELPDLKNYPLPH